MAEKLIGDLTADVLRKMRADRVGAALARITKKPCGCADRQAKMNELHQKWKDVQQRKQNQRDN